MVFSVSDDPEIHRNEMKIPLARGLRYISLSLSYHSKARLENIRRSRSLFFRAVRILPPFVRQNGKFQLWQRHC